jgi:uncharacterized membrane protein HdeD (DUF308 family)
LGLAAFHRHPRLFYTYWNPFFAGLTVAVFTGIALITVGIFHIHFSFVLKKLKKTNGKNRIQE